MNDVYTYWYTVCYIVLWRFSALLCRIYDRKFRPIGKHHQFCLHSYYSFINIPKDSYEKLKFFQTLIRYFVREKLSLVSLKISCLKFLVLQGHLELLKFYGNSESSNSGGFS